MVISGGARGVTPYLAKALAPFSPRLALLGRTSLDPEVDYDALLRSGGDERYEKDKCEEQEQALVLDIPVSIVVRHSQFLLIIGGVVWFLVKKCHSKPGY